MAHRKAPSAVRATIPDQVDPVDEELLPPDPEVGEVIGGYELTKELGRGGAGAVFKAVSPDGETVSLKVLASSKLRKARLIKRFIDEARTASMVWHPGLVALIEFIDQEDPRRLAYAMEFVDGESLRQRLDREHVFDIEMAMRIARQICDAVASIHDAGIVHRDLKPENIMLIDGPSGPKVKLLDFGVAKLVGIDDDVDGPGTFVGTPRYMAPEQAAGGKVDARSDLFALGVIIFEMITGKRPHEGDSLKAVVMAKLQGAPRVTLNPDREVLPKGLSDVVDSCLKLQPTARPDSAKAVMTAIDEALAVLLVVGSIKVGAGSTIVRVQRGQSVAGAGGEAPPDDEVTRLAAAPAAEVPAKPKEPSKIGIFLKTTLAKVRTKVADFRASRAARPVDPNSFSHRISDKIRAFGPGKVAGIVVGVFVLACALVAILARKPAPSPETKPVASTRTSTQSVALARTGSTATAGLSPYTIHVTTRPPGAGIFVGTATIGVTPCDVALDEKTRELNVAIRLDGYKPLAMKLNRSTFADLRLEMPPDPAARLAVDAGVQDAAAADVEVVKKPEPAPQPLDPRLEVGTRDAGVSDQKELPREVLELLGETPQRKAPTKKPTQKAPPAVPPPPPADGLPPAHAIP